MPQSSLTLWIALGVAAVLAAVFLRWWLAPARRHERALRKAIRRISHDTLVERIIPDGLDGEIQIDLVALTPKGLLVLEVRHAHGTVYGATSLDQWTALTPTTRMAFDNPLVLMNQRVIALRGLFGDDVPVDGRVVLVG
ncbi:MAG: nuclease-related domain-containing protein, partial [Pseudomonadota bacterium]